jgi:hypothetical protein
MESYHGTGAFNLTIWSSWDSILFDMLQQPKDVVIVSARRRGRGHGGGSKNNPYLEVEDVCQCIAVVLVGDNSFLPRSVNFFFTHTILFLSSWCWFPFVCMLFIVVSLAICGI